MSDLIKREDAIKALMAEAKEQFRLDPSYAYVIGALRNVEDAIRNIPSADRPQGEWIKLYGDSRFMCSICKCLENVPTCMGKPSVWDYCPNCGARMKGADDE